jgi:hypothetical protein
LSSLLFLFALWTGSTGRSGSKISGSYLDDEIRSAKSTSYARVQAKRSSGQRQAEIFNIATRKSNSPRSGRGRQWATRKIRARRISGSAQDELREAAQNGCTAEEYAPQQPAMTAAKTPIGQAAVRSV